MAQLTPISLIAPGAYGLNTEREYNLLSPQWATEALNCVITGGGRIGARDGWTTETTTPISDGAQIDVVFEYIQKDGTKFIISAANNLIYKDVDDFTDAANDITSSTAPTADNWQFINFNDYVLGFQDGHAPIQWQGTGDFADVSYSTTGQPGTPVPGNAAHAAFGRVWYIDDDKQTIRYSALLDHTDLTTGNGGGSIDMSSVWTLGMDQAVAVASLGANLIVFGKNHIVIWVDGTGSNIGLNPANMYVVDTIEGTGCIARDSVQAIGEGDLWFLSRHGVQSLNRVIQQKNNPIASVTRNIKSKILGYIATEVTASADLVSVRSTFSPEEQFYLLTFPASDRIICIDTRRPFQDPDSGDVTYGVTEWDVGGPIAGLCARQNGDLYFGAQGEVGKYNDTQDDGSSYEMQFWTGWLDFGPEFNNRLKMLKELGVLMSVTGGSSATFRWEFDFNNDIDTFDVAYDIGLSEYNIAEYNIGEYSGGLVLFRKNIPGSNQGQYIRVGATVTVNGFRFIIQQMQLHPKLGRMVV